MLQKALLEREKENQPRLLPLLMNKNNQRMQYGFYCTVHLRIIERTLQGLKLLSKVEKGTECSLVPKTFCFIKLCFLKYSWGGPRNFPTGADSSNKGSKILFLWHYKCQNSPKAKVFTFRLGAIAP